MRNIALAEVARTKPNGGSVEKGRDSGEIIDTVKVESDPLAPAP